jgi:hypothetical protein
MITKKFLLKVCFIPLMVIGTMILVSCSNNDDKTSSESVLPFKSVSVEADNETVEATVADTKHLNLSFNMAEKFDPAKVKVELTPGYTLIYPTNPDSADLATYPVLNFRAPDNHIVKYWFNISSKALPILDQTKIDANGISNEITVSNAKKEVVIAFDNTKMDMSDITLKFNDGSLMEGASVSDNLTYDFTQGLSQDLAVNSGGVERHYTVRLDVSPYLGNPKTYGFTNVTSTYADQTKYPSLNIYHTTTVLNVPVANGGGYPETPWSWDGPDISWYLAYVGDWTANRELTSAPCEIFYATMDDSALKGRLASVNDSMTIAKMSDFIALGGISKKEETLLYVDSKEINNSTNYGAKRSGGIGFSKDGKMLFNNMSIIDGVLYKYPFATDFPDKNYVGTPWTEAVSAASGRTWAVRNGHLMTRLDLYHNDDTGWEVCMGEAWNGVWRYRSFVGRTYDNKIGVCVCVGSDAGQWMDLSAPQTAWLLYKLGWRDVFCCGTNYWQDNDYTPSLRIGGKMIWGSDTQKTEYCIGFSLK